MKRGVIVMTKEDMGFRQLMLRGAVKDEVEWMLLNPAYNLRKLHHKTQKRRLGTGLVVLKGFPGRIIIAINRIMGNNRERD